MPEFKSFAQTGDVVDYKNDVEFDQEERRLIRGGHVMATGISITWQNGPCDRAAGQKANGAFIEDLLEACRLRLKAYQESPFGCEENAEAMAHISSALWAMTRRREDRKNRGVLGKDEV